MKTQAFLCAALVLLASVQAADYVVSARHDNEAWFFFNNPPIAQRYDLKERKWLEPMKLPLKQDESILAAAFALDRIYLAIGTATGAGSSIYEFSLDGAERAFFNSMRWKAASLTVDGDLLVAVAQPDYNQQFSQINIFNRISHERVSEFSSYSPVIAATVVPGMRRIVAFNPALQLLNYMDYDSNGNLTDLSKGAYYSYAWSSHIQFRFFGGGSDRKLVDTSSGYIYSVDDLSYEGRLASDIGDLAPLNDGSFIASRKLHGYELVRYTPGWQEVRSVQLANFSSNIWTCGDYVLAFSRNDLAATGFEVQAVPLASLEPASPPEPPLATPVLTSAVVNADGSVTLTWEPVADAVAYNVQRTSDPNAGNNWIALGRVADGSTTFTDTSGRAWRQLFLHGGRGKRARHGLRTQRSCSRSHSRTARQHAHPHADARAAEAG